jgi:hypothetical protein
MRSARLSALLLLTPLADAAAQELPLQPGQRVRVTVPSADVSKQQATFQRVAGDTLVLSSASYAMADVTRLDVHAGRRSNAWGGALIGALVLGSASLVTVEVFCNSGQMTCGSENASAMAGVLGVVGGAWLGAAIGAFVKSDRWQEVSLDRVRVGVAPTRDGQFALGISLTF